MQLLNQRVKHLSLGSGTIVVQDDTSLTVEFNSKTCRFPYPSPDTFKRFLKAEDPTVHAAILQEMADQKRAAEEARTATEEAKRKAEEARAAEQARLDAEAAEKASVRLRSSGSSRPQTVRVPGKPLTFYVFQGGTFTIESRGGFIWAPLHSDNGNRVFHWDNMELVKAGDIILHGYDAKVVAVSKAISDCYESLRPKERDFEESWPTEGRRVDLQYIVFKNPVPTADYVHEILEYCKAKYSPFNRDGNGNLGYLYELNRELARVFLRAAVRSNPELNDVDYIQKLLSEEE